MPPFVPQTLMRALRGACGGTLWCLAGLGPAAAQTAQTAQTAPEPVPGVVLLPAVTPASGVPSSQLPIVLRADKVSARPDLDAQAEGGVEFRRGTLTIRADRLTYDTPEDLARATGQVVVRTEGAVYRGPELQLRVQRFEGFFLQPEFEFQRLGSGGRADRVDFIDSARATATQALYTSCPRNDGSTPDWVLTTRSVRMDFDANEGVAEGAVLRFLGVPILAAPVLSFPLTDDRKSGWLPPSFNLDNRSGLEVSVPFYWNIAPHRDATITPRIITRRGVGAAGEFRYLEPSYSGQLNLDLLPNDRVADRSRHSLSFLHDGTFGPGIRYAARIDRVSDDDWWRDFPDAGRVLTPRLLPLRLSAARDLNLGGARGEAYAQVLRWQVLQGTETITPPYERSPQVGARLGGRVAGAFEWQAETEVNQFTLPSFANVPDARLEGARWHALASVSRPWREPGWWVVPKLSLNAASYRTDRPMSDGRSSASRFVPSVSVDAGLEFERDAVFFGRSLRQTLEPRVHYVNTPFRAQTALPNFDSAERDFNFTSIFADNTFTGIDRVSDSHQIAAGVTTRLLDGASGAEALRLGLVQRYLLRTQRITADGVPLEQRLSDLLLVGSTSVIPQWSFDAALQYSPDIDRTRRALLAARWAPGEFRTLSTTYRLTRGASEQMEVGWQWPLRLSSPGPAAQARASSPAGALGGSGCGGAWYTVGRVNYSMQERRITDSVIGFEYDAGCWIGRVVAERLSTGRSEATTRLLLQLELVGLSRIGANPLKVLKDNIPGYRLLRDDVRAATPASPSYD